MYCINSYRTLLTFLCVKVPEGFREELGLDAMGVSTQILSITPAAPYGVRKMLGAHCGVNARRKFP